MGCFDVKRTLSRIAAALVLLVALVAAFVVGVRLFSDGPMAMLPGGPMSGSLTAERFPGFDNSAGERVELEIKGWRRSSRTVLGFLLDGNLYVPSVQAESKWWPARVIANPDVVIRHRGNLYPRVAVRVSDPELIGRLQEVLAGAETLASTPEMFAADSTWYFRLDPR
jgi:hypothetical protein